MGVSVYSLDFLETFQYDSSTLIVDAFLGTGVQGVLREADQQIISQLNKLGQEGCTLLSLDIPSGLSADFSFFSTANSPKISPTFFPNSL